MYAHQRKEIIVSQDRTQQLKNTARQIYDHWCNDPGFYERVVTSCEPYRAMMYCNGFFDGEAIDGTCEYEMMVDELERLVCEVNS